MKTYMSDIELINACLVNDRKAQEQLYRQYFPKMIAMCFRYTTDREKAMTIVNDGFLKVFTKLDSFNHQGSFEGWIRRIVFNALSDYFKKENRYLKFMILEDRDKPTKEVNSDKLYYEDLLEMVKELPNATQKVFRLYAIEGFNHREIAEQLCISQGTSKWHLSEARKKLKELIYQENRSIQNAG